MAQSEGRLLFLNPSTGRAIFGGVDQVGKFAPAGGETFQGLVGQDKLVPVDAGILTYDQNTGASSLFQIDGYAFPAVVSGLHFSSNWFLIRGFGNYLFFYNFGSDAAIVAIDPNGDDAQTDARTNLSTWSNITPTDNYLFFYQESTGVVVIGAITNIGKLVQLSNTTAATGYTQIASVGDNVFLYNFNTGAYESGPILLTGTGKDRYQQTTMSKLAAGYAFFARSNEYLVMYNQKTGGMQIGYFNLAGTFVPTETTAVARGWTHLLSTGQFLTFYSFQTGDMQIGYIDHAGKWVTTQSTKLAAGAGYSSAASTTR